MAEFRLKGVFYGGSTGKLHHQGKEEEEGFIRLFFHSEGGGWSFTRELESPPRTMKLFLT